MALSQNPGDTNTTRRIFKTAQTAENTIKELVTLILMSEVSDPGSEVYFVSPWISNVPLLDNRNGSFDTVNPDWGHRLIRLVDITSHLITLGCTVQIVTRSDTHNRYFLSQLSEIIEDQGLLHSLRILIRDSLHTKGILTKHGVLIGSMNLTYNGFTELDEVVTYDKAEQEISQARLAFSDYNTERHHGS